MSFEDDEDNYLDLIVADLEGQLILVNKYTKVRRGCLGYRLEDNKYPVGTTFRLKKEYQRCGDGCCEWYDVTLDGVTLREECL